ncbi:MAG: hypothetical protein O6939_00870, partial [Bacteroidetes bacterium]|nr:hypothetical protein [Bacteroidota bacterium]
LTAPGLKKLEYWLQGAGRLFGIIGHLQHVEHITVDVLHLPTGEEPVLLQGHLEIAVGDVHHFLHPLHGLPQVARMTEDFVQPVEKKITTVNKPESKTDSGDEPNQEDKSFFDQIG